MIGDIQLSEMVRDEILQRRQEGCTVPAYAIEHAEDAELNRTNQNLYPSVKACGFATSPFRGGQITCSLARLP